MLKLLNNLSILLLFVSIVCMSSIYSDWYPDPIFGHIGHMQASVDDGLSSSLDLSKDYPYLEQLELRDRRVGNYSPAQAHHYLAKDDAGLSKNVNLKGLRVSSVYSQIPVSLSHLPSVEYYYRYFGSREVVAHNLDYLSRVLPSLKTLELVFLYQADLKRKVHFGNISKLEHLENLYINMGINEWGASYTYSPIKDGGKPVRGTLTFTDQEIKALSKMHSLKNLHIKIRVPVDMMWTAIIEFDRERLQLLRNLLPNMNVKIEFYAK